MNLPYAFRRSTDEFDAWAKPLFDGRTIEEVGDACDGDLLGEDPKEAWTDARAEASRYHRTEGVTE